MIHKTIREIAAAWKEYKRPYVKQSTMAAYVLILENHILPTFGEDNSLPEQSVQAFVLHKIESGLSTKSVKDILIVLKMVMKFGVKKEWMTYYEWDIKYPPSSENKVLDVLSVTNHRKILNHIQSHFTFMGLGIYISLSTGLRIGEICALKWSDINVTDGILTVNRTIERIYIIEGEKKHTELVIDYVATRNQVNISNLNAIQRFTDTESHPDFIFRFTLSMPIVNTYSEPYLCIRKVPKSFPMMTELVEKEMLDRNTAELLVQRFRQGSTLICGGNSSGKTTLLNALKETLPDDMAILVAQQADELTTLFHPDMMFLHSLPGTSESSVNYDLKHISIAGLTMDVDFFIIGEVKGGEALYLLNAAYTGQICAATVHAPSADRAPEKIVDYAMYDSRYSRNELMKMMDCFQTLVFMEHYQVKEIFACLGWNAEKENLEYERLF